MDHRQERTALIGTSLIESSGSRNLCLSFSERLSEKGEESETGKRTEGSGTYSTHGVCVYVFPLCVLRVYFENGSRVSTIRRQEHAETLSAPSALSTPFRTLLLPSACDQIRKKWYLRHSGSLSTNTLTDSLLICSPILPHEASVGARVHFGYSLTDTDTLFPCTFFALFLSVR